MKPLEESMKEFRKELRKGVIQDAYRGLIIYIMNLKTYLKKKHPGYHVSGSFY